MAITPASEDCPLATLVFGDAGTQHYFLNTSSSYTIIPWTAYEAFWNNIWPDFIHYSNLGLVGECPSPSERQGTIDFHFASSSIQIPFSDFLIPLPDYLTPKDWAGTKPCAVGFLASNMTESEHQFVLGASFFRGVYSK